MLFIILKKKFFRIKVIYSKQKKKIQKINQKINQKKKRVKKCIEYIEKESKGLNCNLFKYYFKFSVPSALAKEYMKQKIKIKAIS